MSRHNNYADLQSLHQQIRAAKPASQIEDVALQNVASVSADKPPAQSGAHNATTNLSDRNKPKSFTQVETLVRPQVVSPKSCELKLGRRRPYRLMGRFSKLERAAVIANAKASSLSVNEYIRSASLGSTYKPPMDQGLRQTLLMVYRELTAQGNNLNQIAKRLNEGSATPQQGAFLLDVIYAPLVRALGSVRKALSRGAEEPIP